VLCCSYFDVSGVCISFIRPLGRRHSRSHVQCRCCARGYHFDILEHQSATRSIFLVQDELTRTIVDDYKLEALACCSSIHIIVQSESSVEEKLENEEWTKRYFYLHEHKHHNPHRSGSCTPHSHTSHSHYCPLLLLQSHPPHHSSSP